MWLLLSLRCLLSLLEVIRPFFCICRAEAGSGHESGLMRCDGWLADGSHDCICDAAWLMLHDCTLTLRDTNHRNESDINFVFPSLIFHWAQFRLDITTAHTINLEICHAFFRRHLLKGYDLFCVLIHAVWWMMMSLGTALKPLFIPRPCLSATHSQPGWWRWVLGAHHLWNHRLYYLWWNQHQPDRIPEGEGKGGGEGTW